jgi:hypothetical protein
MNRALAPLHQPEVRVLRAALRGAHGDQDKMNESRTSTDFTGVDYVDESVETGPRRSGRFGGISVFMITFAALAFGFEVAWLAVLMWLIIRVVF